MDRLVCRKGMQGNCFDKFKHDHKYTFLRKLIFVQKSQILRIRHCLPIIKCCLFFKVTILLSKYILI